MKRPILFLLLFPIVCMGAVIVLDRGAIRITEDDKVKEFYTCPDGRHVEVVIYYNDDLPIYSNTIYFRLDSLVANADSILVKGCDKDGEYDERMYKDKEKDKDKDKDKDKKKKKSIKRLENIIIREEEE